MNTLDKYMQRSQDIIGERTPEEERYDNEVVRNFKNFGDMRKAIDIANEIYPDEALKYDDKSIHDIKEHYDYLSKHMDILAKMTNHQPLDKGITRTSTKIGRNDLCPCGSGKKYKKCCMNQSLEKQNTSTSWLDDDGLHIVDKSSQPSNKDLERMTIEYKNKIKKSPIWGEMVREYGNEKAEEMLKEFKVQ